MEDLADDPREFAHSGNVDLDEDGLPPGIDAFLRACPPESYAR
jgi:E3 ubiquitin-protein ligase RNF115/126